MVGPFYCCMAEDGFRLGFRVEDRHCNLMGRCHGAMLASLMDMELSLAARFTDESLRPRTLATISLQLDFMSAAPNGSWVHGNATVLRATRNLVFMSGLALADDEPVARASGVFRIGGAASGSNVDMVDPGRYI